MIKLKFNVCSFYCPSENAKQQCKKYSVLESYDENRIFSDIMLEIHSKYKIDNGKYENYFIPHLTELMWGQYFSKEICYAIDNSEEEYYKIKLCDLEKQFNISGMIIPVYLNYDGIGKAIGAVEGIKLYFHFNEKDLHHRPHIHCKYSGIETRIEIDTLKALDKPFKKSKMKVALETIEKHKVELLNYWEKAIINGEPIELNIEI